MSELDSEIRMVTPLGRVVGCAYHQRGECEIARQETLRAEAAEAERDQAQLLLQHCAAVCRGVPRVAEDYEQAMSVLAPLMRERDQLRAEVERWKHTADTMRTVYEEACQERDDLRHDLELRQSHMRAQEKNMAELRAEVNELRDAIMQDAVERTDRAIMQSLPLCKCGHRPNSHDGFFGKCTVVGCNCRRCTP